MKTMLRRSALLPLAGVAAVAVAACGGSAKATGSTTSASTGAGAYGASSSSPVSSTAPAAAASSATVRLASTSMGKILVNSRGFTAYLFTADRPNSDQCMKVSGCTSIWPPLTVKGQAKAGSGVNKSLLSTIKLSNGLQQVTYAGHPLYTYTGDGSPASTDYIGATTFGGTWLGVSATGKAVH